MKTDTITRVKQSTITNVYIACASLFAGFAALAAAATLAGKPLPMMQDLIGQCKDKTCVNAVSNCSKTRKCTDLLKACISTSINKTCGFQSIEKAYACEDTVRVDCSFKVLGMPLNFKKKIVPVTACIDPDGDDFFNASTTTAPSKPQGVLDYCQTIGGKEYLLEGICADNEYAYQQKDCMELGNYVCNKGLCVPDPAVCGDGILSKGEACDDGNLMANDSCSITCKTATVPVMIQSSCSYKDEVVTVRDNSGLPLKDVQITVYQYKDALNIVPFPYQPFADSDIVAIGKTDSQGKYVFAGKNLINGYGHVVVANHPGYIGRFSNGFNCAGMKSDTVFNLTSVTQYNGISPEAKKMVDPVKIFSRFVNWSLYEVAGRTIVFPYVPVMRDDIKATAKQVDVTLKAVVSQPAGWIKNPVPIGLVLNPDKAFQYEQTSENVKLNEMQTFEFSLPGGMYYFYFIFTVHDNDGVVTTYTYYPSRFQYGLDTAGSAPNNISGTLLDNTSEYQSTLFVYPPFTDSQFEPLSSMENNPVEKRVNVVFLNVGFEENLFSDIVAYAVSGGSDSLLNTEPIKSNVNKFNFWYYKPPLSPEHATWQFGNISKIYFGEEDLTKIQKMYLSNNFFGKVIFYALINDDTLTAITTVASSGKCQFVKGVAFGIARTPFNECLETNQKAYCFEEFNIDRIVTHEMGHELGVLGEEYLGDGKLFDINEFVKNKHWLYTPNQKKNVFFSEFLPLDTYCTQSLYSSGKFPFNYAGNQFICTNAPADACSGAPWADLIGNGCGKDGKIDCGPDDANYTNEVGCHFGAGLGNGSQSYINIQKPTRVSIMDFGAKYLYYKSKNTDQSRKYGLANERTLCRAIQAYTGGVGGVCGQLCLAGCNFGERCVQGMCMPATAVD